MAEKSDKVPALPKDSGWGEFLHWVYCPDAPGKCKCKCKPEVE
jgi:hypothetical protein